MRAALYAAYLTGTAGQSIGLFYIGDGILAGIDVGTMKYDGAYTTNPDGSLEGAIEYIIPAGGPLITGGTPSVSTARITVPLKLPVGFDDGRVITINTPLGPVNARFEKVKDLPA